MKYQVVEATASAVVLSDRVSRDEWGNPAHLTLGCDGSSLAPGGWVELFFRQTTAPADDVPNES